LLRCTLVEAAKARGVVLGNPSLATMRDRAVASLKDEADRFARNVAPIIPENSIEWHRIVALRGR